MLTRAYRLVYSSLVVRRSNSSSFFLCCESSINSAQEQRCQSLPAATRLSIRRRDRHGEGTTSTWITLPFRSTPTKTERDAGEWRTEGMRLPAGTTSRERGNESAVSSVNLKKKKKKNEDVLGERTTFYSVHTYCFGSCRRIFSEPLLG